jgi:hypothetical protein
LEIERPTQIVDTWLFEGWADAEAVETVDLHETDRVTKVKMNLAFRDQAARYHRTKTDGQEDSWGKMEDYLRSLVDPSETVSGTWASSQMPRNASAADCPRMCKIFVKWPAHSCR